MSDYKPIIFAAILAGLMITIFVGYSVIQPVDDTVVITQPVRGIEREPEQVLKEELASAPSLPEIKFQNRPEDKRADLAEIDNSNPREPQLPSFVLPLLDDSDQLIRDGVVSLTRNETINFWLAPTELIRKFVVFVDNIANGKISRDVVEGIAPEKPFSVTTISHKTFLLDPLSYERYDEFTEVLTSIDARRAAQFYELLEPLFQEAFEELGYPEKNFTSIVYQAIGQLLEAPVVEEPILLTRPVVMYEFLDPSLEALSASQKQMIRLGPENTKALQLKLSEIALELRTTLNN